MKKILILITLCISCSGVTFGSKKPKTDPVETTPIKIDPVTPEVKSLFPDPKWTAHVLAEIERSGLPTSQPKDAMAFCGAQGMSATNWMHLIASMVKFESGFDSNQTYRENFRNSKGEYVISTGLLQLSYESVAGYGFRVTTEQLKDPYLNLTIGVKILERWVLKDGVITSGGKPYRGGARYWSVLRSSGKLNSVKSTLKTLCQ